MAKPLNCFLVTFLSPDGATRKVINENTFNIGRAHECAISFSDLNVSRNHLLVKCKSGKVWIEDLASANGTFINGGRIDPKRMCLVEPTDIIKLGANGPELQMQALERVFSDRALEESSLKQEDKEAVLSLITGAHAEAARIVASGKETHDKLIRLSEEKCAQLDQQTKANHEKVMNDARQSAKSLIDSAKAHYDKTVAECLVDAMKAANGEVAQLLEEAQSTAVRTVQEAKIAATAHLESVRVEADKYSREHKESSERDADAYFSKRHQEIEQYSIKKTAEVDEYRAQQEKSSREMMTSEIERYIREKREVETSLNDTKTRLEASLTETKALFEASWSESKAKLQASLNETKIELDQVLPKLESARREFDNLKTQVGELRAENERLKVEKAEILALQGKREELATQVDRFQKQLSAAEKDLPARLAENHSAFEKETTKRRTALEEELTGLRLAEMEHLRRERASAIEAINRERVRLGQKIMIDVQNAAVTTVPMESWRAVAPAVETAIRENLQLNSLSEASEESLSPLISQMSATRRRTRLVWTLQGFFAGILLLGIGWRTSQQLLNNQDPVKAEAEESARKVKEDFERRKFNPAQDEQLRPSYLDSVIYTHNFVENYRAAEFQKAWLKKSSAYFLKKWKVQEESVVQVLAATNTLVGTLAERKEAIHPDHVQEGLKKMGELENETLEKIKELLGSEVRLEAFKRLEKKTYEDFYSGRAPAQDEPAQE